MQTPFITKAAASLLAGGQDTRGELRESTNPATDETLGEYHDAPLEVVLEAIASARDTLTTTTWRADRDLRSRTLWRLSLAIEENLERLALAITLENGKTLAQAQTEVSIAAPRLRYYAGLALTDTGAAALTRTGALSATVHEPVGVAGIIVPWNSPVILAIRSLAPALAAGCTAVVKMPAQTALTNGILSEIIARCVPPGIVNIFTETGDAGAKELVSSAEINVISYTGSTKVGSHIMAAAAPTLKRVSLELGGKTPMIIFDDADLERAIPVVTAGITTFAGQFCMAGSRILVQDTIADRVKDLLSASLSSVRIGPGADPTTEMGPLIDHESVARVDDVVDRADADVVLRGGPRIGPGAFYAPSLLATQDLRSPLIQEEIFGPVAVLETFRDEDEAVQRSNATRYGLAAAVWTRNGARSLRVSSALEVGTVWTNDWAQIADQFEEGGYKMSGVGRLNGTGGLSEFQETKHIHQAN